MWKLGLKIFGIAGVVALLITLWNYFWHRPEEWNGTAKGYLAHVGRLSIDSAYWHGRSDRADSVIAVRDKSIGKYQSDSSKTALYADSLTKKYNTAVAQSDANADLLSTQLAQAEYYRNLIANGTLKRTVIDIPTLQPTSRDVIVAGLKTSNREKIQRGSLDSMGRAVSQYKLQNEHKDRAITIAGKGMSDIEVRAKQDAKSRALLIIKTKRTRSGERTLVTIDSTRRAIKKELSEESPLENALNHP